MKTFGSLRMLEQGMEIVATAHQLVGKYTQTEMIDLINQISLTAIGIPSNIAACSKQDTPNAYQEGLKRALSAVQSIDEKLSYLPCAEPTLDKLRSLIYLEHQMIAQAIGGSSRMTMKRPAKTSRLSLASMKMRAPMPHIKVSLGVQGELF